MNQRVGIEALTIAVPERFLALEDLAVARGVEPAKFTAGLGGREMAVADPGEDSVALAATAVAKLLKSYAIDPNRIGMLVVGTETGVDHSKAVASYVQGLLGLPRGMRTYDTQHACYGGTAALMAASDWVAAGHAHGKAAIVVCSDIARYGLRTAGEPTQGAGAVALLVSDKPDLFELDRGVSGMASSHVFDFWRPLGSREAVVDGHYSINCYLEALGDAYAGYLKLALDREVVRHSEQLPSEQLSRIAYHVPFCKMAKKAHFHLRKTEVKARLGRELTAEEQTAEDRAATISFENQVAPTLALAARIGNTYTGSLYLGLASLLQTQGASLAGKRIGMFSYGSGNSSEFFSGVVGANASATIAKAELDQLLANRRRVTMEEYEQVMEMNATTPPAATPRPGTFRFTGITEHRRNYIAG
ncbi:MAG TPA: hydroxymethylglutaryl-CoA synthase [Myxococcota bacterium]|nr:hydroxymethylglutaryl-CoA synthase [Myxococcota bacterium]